MLYWNRNLIAASELPPTASATSGVYDLTSQLIFKAGNTWPAESSVVTSGLVLHVDAGNTSSYPGSGTTWTDISGQSINGTLTNGPTYSSADGGYFDFDGSNDYIEFSSQLDPIADGLFANSAASWSVSSWFNPDNVSGGAQSINSKSGGTGTSATYVTFVDSGSLKVRLRGGGVTTVSSVSNSNWYEVVVTWDGTTAKAYLNGTFQTNVSVGTRTKQTNSFKIAASGTGTSSLYNGKVSTALVYDKALTAAEVTQNYNALKGRYGL